MRISLLSLASILVLSFGCGDDGGSTDTDGGTVDVDSGTTDGGTTDTDGGTTDAGDAIDPTTMCPAGACDLLTGGGCDTGEACYYGAESSGDAPMPICVPVGEGVEGDECTNLNDCGAGMTCANGECRTVCCGTNDANCGEDTACTLINLAGATVEGYGACLPNTTCDLLEQSGCDEGEGCYPVSEGAACLTPINTVAIGEVCEAANQCEPGAVCVSGTCASICDRTATESTCPEGVDCAEVTNFPENVGFCPNEA